MEIQKLTLEERLQVLEVLIEEAIWGPSLDRPEHRKAIASALYTRLGVVAGHQTYPASVISALYEHADALSELDNTPDALRPALRSLIR